VDLAYLDALLSGTYATPLSFERPALRSEDEQRWLKRSAGHE
jgi:hypothetical protein